MHITRDEKRQNRRTFISSSGASRKFKFDTRGFLHTLTTYGNWYKVSVVKFFFFFKQNFCRLNFHKTLKVKLRLCMCTYSQSTLLTQLDRFCQKTKWWLLSSFPHFNQSSLAIHLPLPPATFLEFQPNDVLALITAAVHCIRPDVLPSHQQSLNPNAVALAPHLLLKLPVLIEIRASPWAAATARELFCLVKVARAGKHKHADVAYCSPQTVRAGLILTSPPCFDYSHTEKTMSLEGPPLFLMMESGGSNSTST